jgi:hypothetical protein
MNQEDWEPKAGEYAKTADGRVGLLKTSTDPKGNEELWLFTPDDQQLGLVQTKTWRDPTIRPWPEVGDVAWVVDSSVRGDSIHGFEIRHTEIVLEPNEAGKPKRHPTRYLAEEALRQTVQHRAELKRELMAIEFGGICEPTDHGTFHMIRGTNDAYERDLKFARQRMVRAIAERDEACRQLGQAKSRHDSDVARLVKERDKIQAKCERQAEQLQRKDEVLHKKNLALDALDYVWCDGGCRDGVHRHTGGEITEELVAEAERNTKRLRTWLANKTGEVVKEVLIQGPKGHQMSTLVEQIVKIGEEVPPEEWKRYERNLTRHARIESKLRKLMATASRGVPEVGVGGVVWKEVRVEADVWMALREELATKEAS